MGKNWPRILGNYCITNFNFCAELFDHLSELNLTLDTPDSRAEGTFTFKSIGSVQLTINDQYKGPKIRIQSLNRDQQKIRNFVR
jgi:hypothetical protein